MKYAESWGEILYSLNCLSSGSAKKQFRNSIRYSFGGLCAYCREQRATTLDHLRPKSKGGSNLRSNLVPACKSCNHAKGSNNWLQWYEQQDFYNAVVKELIEEWIQNKRYVDGDLVNEHLDDRAAVRLTTCEV